MSDNTPASSPHTFITHVQIGDVIEGVYYVEAVYFKTTQHGKPYTDFVLRDCSGRATVKFWGLDENIVKGGFAEMVASADNYQGSLSIVARKIRKYEDAVDMSLYLPTIETTADDLSTFQQLRLQISELCQKANNLTCSLLLERIFTDAVMPKFTTAPASTMPHYGRQGGLLLQTVRVSRMVINISASYNLTAQENAIALAAALVYRLGAIDVYEFQDCMPIESRSGILVGVDTRTVERLTTAIRGLTSGKNRDDKADYDTAVQVLHTVAGYRETYVQPMTKPALVLAQAHRADSVLVGAFDFIEQDANNDEFTAFDPILRRRYFKGKI